MPEKELHKTLAELHQELESAEHLDTEARAALIGAMDDIRAALERSGEEPAADDAPLSEKVREMVSHFESEHPTFAEMLNRLSEGLATLGI